MQLTCGQNLGQVSVVEKGSKPDRHLCLLQRSLERRDFTASRLTWPPCLTVVREMGATSFLS